MIFIIFLTFIGLLTEIQCRSKRRSKKNKRGDKAKNVAKKRRLHSDERDTSIVAQVRIVINIGLTYINYTNHAKGLQNQRNLNRPWPY